MTAALSGAADETRRAGFADRRRTNRRALVMPAGSAGAAGEKALAAVRSGPASQPREGPPQSHACATVTPAPSS
jgi:hypothetical protein